MAGFPAKFAALAMHSMAALPRRGDGHLWAIALGLSLFANLVIVALVGFAALESAKFRKLNPPAPPPPAETVATIYAQPAESPPVAAPAPEPEKKFARTSEDQAAPPEKKTLFEGERDTRATSDRAPVASAPALPSQAGVEPRDATDIETTESDYQDGGLAANAPAAAPSAEPVPPAPPAEVSPPARESSAAEPTAISGTDAITTKPPPREVLAEGPNPVDIEVPRDTAEEDEIKPSPKPQTAESLPPAPKPPDAPKPPETAAPKATRDPAFSGFQRKTAVMGSISRTGRSSLDVDNTALGRYQAAISRAVELEWQRNCVRHRDFITPGFLTVRFFVETSGKVRSVQFVGDMETGEVQKGFTLNSIRDAEIPAMPRDLRAEYDKQPLELIFRFYF